MNTTNIDWNTVDLDEHQRRNAERLVNIPKTRFIQNDPPKRDRAYKRPPKVHVFDSETRKGYIQAKKAHKGFVYVVEHNGLYKIGLTTSVRHRLPELKRRYKLTYINVVLSIATDDMFKLEKALHREYQNCRQHGEWFLLTANDVQELLQRFDTAS